MVHKYSLENFKQSDCKSTHYRRLQAICDHNHIAYTKLDKKSLCDAIEKHLKNTTPIQSKPVKPSSTIQRQRVKPVPAARKRSIALTPSKKEKKQDRQLKSLNKQDLKKQTVNDYSTFEEHQMSRLIDIANLLHVKLPPNVKSMRHSDILELSSTAINSFIPDLSLNVRFMIREKLWFCIEEFSTDVGYNIYSTKTSHLIDSLLQIWKDIETRGFIHYLPHMIPDNPSLTQMYVFEKTLGEGGFGKVYLCQRKSDNKLVALKQIRITHSNSFKSIQRECDIMMQISCKSNDTNCSIVKLYQAFKMHGMMNMEMEYVKDGDSLNAVSEFRERNSTEFKHFVSTVLIPCAEKLIYTLNEIHQKHHILHLDIKPQNLLWDKINNRFLFADFGVSCIAKQCSTEHRGTFTYQDPILLQNSRATPTVFSDIYSLAVTFYRFITGTSDYKSEESKKRFDQYKTMFPNPKSNEYILHEFVKRTLQDPLSNSGRPSLGTVLEAFKLHDANRMKHIKSDETLIVP